MYGPVSPEFLAAIRGSGKRVLSADLYYGGELIRSEIPVIDGNVSSDSASDVRRSGRVSVINPDLIEGDQSDSGLPFGITAQNPLTVYGSEIIIKSGVEYGSGNQELIPLGVFVIWTSSQSEELGDVVDLELFDRSKYLAHGEIPKFYDASGQTVQTAIQNLVNAGMPNPQTVTFGAGLPSVTLPGGTTYDSTYLAAILDLADSIGAEFYFDVEGNPQCARKPFIDASTADSAAVFTADCGESGTNTAIARDITRDEVYNGVGVYGSVPDPFVSQPFGEVFDLDSASPTFYNGPFGKAFKRIDRPELTTSAQCTTAAQAELDAILGRARGVRLSMLPAMHLEPGDIILVGYYHGATELHLIESIDFDLAELSFSIQTKGRVS